MEDEEVCVDVESQKLKGFGESKGASVHMGSTWSAPFKRQKVWCDGIEVDEVSCVYNFICLVVCCFAYGIKKKNHFIYIVCMSILC